MYTRNLDEFYFGKNNICFITGLSGCGKTTEAKFIKSQYPIKCTIIHLDYFEHCYQFSSLQEVKEKAGFVFWLYFRQNLKVYNKLKRRELHSQELCNEIRKFLQFVVEYCLRHQNKKFLIEGIQIYCFLNLKKYKDFSFIVFTTPIGVCMRRRIRRTLKTEKIKNISKLEIPQMLSYYIEESKMLRHFMKTLKT